MIIPSIDIIGGKAVQLRRGKDLILESDRDPLDLATEFNRYGEVAVIDLDAATGNGSNYELIQKLCRVADVRVGGGIRDIDTARALLRAGAKSLIIGTMASPEFLSQLPLDKIIVALDHISEEVLDNGWTNSTGESIWVRADRLTPYCSGFLVTYVESEGCLTGLPLRQVAKLSRRLKRPITVAGGVASTAEVSRISALGVDVQVGMALYKGLIDPVEAVVQSISFSQNINKGRSPTGVIRRSSFSVDLSVVERLDEAEGTSDERSMMEGVARSSTKCAGVAVDPDVRYGEVSARLSSPEDSYESNDTDDVWNLESAPEGLVPTIVQDEDGQVLMLAYSSPESLRLALRQGRGIYFSRSRGELWEKGATSGAAQELISCRVDCDSDSLLFKVRQTKGACHAGGYSCFGKASSSRRFSLSRLFDVLEDRKQSLPRESLSSSLFQDRRKLLKKIMEEAYEVCSFESQENLRWEIADLLYFVSLLAVDEGLSWRDIESELAGRSK